MTHSDNINWNDFYASGIGPELPLNAEARKQLVSGILPSGEMGFFDTRQFHQIRLESIDKIPSGINLPYPYPNVDTEEKYAFVSGESRFVFPDKFSMDWWYASGILITYGPDSDPLQDQERESGVFHFNGEESIFSSGAESQQINDFTLFNGFIHHELINRSAVRIPYLSDYGTAIQFNPYG